MLYIIHALLDDATFKYKVKYSIRQYKAKDKILEQGKEHRFFYLIKQGKVHVIVKDEAKSGSKLKPGIAHLYENDIFGELALFDNMPANADVIAKIDCELIEID